MRSLKQPSKASKRPQVDPKGATREGDTQTNLILIGFSYTGKTQVGRALAEQLARPFFETDDMIVELAGKPIPQIFAHDGEPRFRQLERTILERACASNGAVIATGGGAIVNPENRALLKRSGIVICLEASPDTILKRLQEDSKANPGTTVRPLLQSSDPLTAIQSLKDRRAPYYAEADFTVHTDNLALEQVVDKVLLAYNVCLANRPVVARREATKQSVPPVAADSGRGVLHYAPSTNQPVSPSYTVTTPTTSYPGYVSWHSLDSLGEAMRRAGLSGSAFLIADRSVFDLHGFRALRSIRDAGFEVHHTTIPSGESSKSLKSAQQLYRWLARHCAERNHTIVALGGGVIGDLAGFVAATYLRGIPFVQVPTTLLAMVDASIGGKTAVNLPDGKNLVGAFHQPRLVLADVETLTTLPPRELTSGWAEVIKHALILDPALFEFLDSNRSKLLALDRDLATQAIARSAAIKAAVVSEDEKETTGRRTVLNYGHTIGHAIELLSKFELPHGYCVGYGILAETKIAEILGVLTLEDRAYAENYLARFGITAEPLKRFSIAEIIDATKSDKKTRAGMPQYVLLKGIGSILVKDGQYAHPVEDRIVQQALEALG